MIIVKCVKIKTTTLAKSISRRSFATKIAETDYLEAGIVDSKNDDDELLV